MGIETLELPGGRLSWATVPALRSISATLNSWQPDAVSVHENDDLRLMIAIGRRRYVYTVHDPAPHPGAYQHPLLKLAQQVWRRRAHLTVVHAPALLPRLPSYSRRRRAAVIPHGIDVADEPLPVPSHPRILLFGRLEPYKGMEVLREAMALLWQRRPDARLTIAGRGPLADAVPRDARVDLRLEYVPERDVPRLFAAATVTVLPYTEASQSGVGLLSLSHGVPVIVSDVGGLSELAPRPEALVEPGDPVKLALALENGLNWTEGERRDVLAFARDHFSWDRVASLYVEAFRSTPARALPPSTQ